MSTPEGIDRHQARRRGGTPLEGLDALALDWGSPVFPQDEGAHDCGLFLGNRRDAEAKALLVSGRYDGDGPYEEGSAPGPKVANCHFGPVSATWAPLFSHQ